MAKTASRSNDPIIEFATKIGELSGANQAILSELSKIGNELVRLSAEQDAKHAQNLALIEKRHSENISILTAHQEEDKKNFEKIFRWMNRIAGGVAITTIVVTVIWTIFKWAVPIFTSVKLGE